MSRRSGQSGSVEKKGNAYYARFWLDVPGQTNRVNKCVRICPVSGPGSLNQFERKRRAKEIIAQFGANTAEVLQQAEGVNLGTTFKERATDWLDEVQTRKRKPIKPHTASTWSSYLKYLNTHLGEMPLCEVNNRSVKELIAKMHAEKVDDGPRFSPKSICNYVQIVKSVVASAMSEDGEELYPVKWKNDFMDLPEVKEQHKPTFTAAEIPLVIAEAEGQERVLYMLLAGSGLRVGEALALQAEDVQDAVVRVRHSLWNGRLHSPKTKNGTRDVDLHSSLAEALAEHLGKRSSGYVFRNAAGSGLHQSNVLRRSLHPILRKLELEGRGFHAFRRFRVTHLRKQRVPEDLLRYWIGHADKSITDAYSKVKEDREYGLSVAEAAGLGFKLPAYSVAPVVPRTGVETFAVSA